MKSPVRIARIPALTVTLALALDLTFGAAAWAGPYSPASDVSGSTGVAAGSSSIVGWGTTVVNYTVGPVDISNPGGATANFGTPSNALNAADATLASPYSVFTLGDDPSITIGFAHPITNGTGTDFAVFENALPLSGVPNAYFLELAFVEVSSNGTDFFRFPSVSLTQTTTQVGGFGTLDPTNINNLAGKDIAGYGTAFDLQDLSGASPLLDITAITQVRIVDVVGSINPSYARYDSLGNIINDPWKTNFNTGGFDLDAIGVLHQIPEPKQTVLLLAGILGLAAFAKWQRLRYKKQGDFMP